MDNVCYYFLIKKREAMASLNFKIDDSLARRFDQAINQANNNKSLKSPTIITKTSILTKAVASFVKKVEKGKSGSN